MAAAGVIDMDYEENRPAGVASHECFVSVARAEPLFTAMEKVWPWVPSPSGEANRAGIPIHYLEEGLGNSPVADDYDTWSQRGNQGFEKFLHVWCFELLKGACLKKKFRRAARAIFF